MKVDFVDMSKFNNEFGELNQFVKDEINETASVKQAMQNQLYDIKKDVDQMLLKHSTRAEMRELLRHYAEKDDLNECFAKLSELAVKRDVSDQLEGVNARHERLIKELKEQYTKSEIILDKFNKLNDHIVETYTKKENFVSEFMDCKRSIGKLETQFSGLDETVGTYESRFAVFTEKLKRKALQKDLIELDAQIKRCALYDDLKDLYNKTVIPLVKFSDEYETYRFEHDQIKEMLARFDETMTLKSSKTDILIINAKLSKRVTKEEHGDSENKIYAEFENCHNAVKHTDQKIEFLQKEMAISIADGIKRARAKLSEDAKKLPSMNPTQLSVEAQEMPDMSAGSFKEKRGSFEVHISQKKNRYASNDSPISNRLDGKADMKEMVGMLADKSNKVDTEAMMKGMDLLHRQLENILLLTVEIFKTFVN